MAHQVGKDLDAWCTRCRLDTTHIIVSLKADGLSPKRVECTTCGGQHNYRPPKMAKETAKASRGSGAVSRKAMAVAAAKQMADVTAEAMPAGHTPSKKPPVVDDSEPPAPKKKKKAARKRTAGPKLTAAERAKARAVALAATKWGETLEGADLAGARAYSMRETFAEKDLVEHPRFGVGYVVATQGPQKIEVLFEAGVKTLAMGR
ncbi:MAG TPA: hypothetical protein ENJ18_17765 [Nannocystis exedens]|nr:hypothetical protein [Nannocystis exedens]